MSVLPKQRMTALAHLLLRPVQDGPHETPEWLDDGVPFLSVDGIVDNHLSFSGCRYVSPDAHAEYSRKSRPQRGDVLLTKAASIGKVAIVDTDLDFNVWSPLAILRPDPALLDSRFLYFVLQSTISQDQLQTSSTKNTQQNVAMSDIGTLRIPNLPVADQGVIADYLDRETARIDALIAAKRGMMELLDERRVAAARAAITGVGIPGPRRSSSVAWLGSLPDHWRFASLGSLYEVRLGRMLNAERSAGPHMRPYIRNINVRWEHVDLTDLAEMDFPPAERSRYVLRSGDLLVNEGGAGIGRAAIWSGQVPEIYYQKSVHRIRPRGALGVRWLLEWMRVAVDRHVFEVEGNLATIPHVPAEALRRYPVPLPPVAEAEALLARLEQTVERETALRTATESQIALLQERRLALITAGVTGQLDVPETA